MPGLASDSQARHVWQCRIYADSGFSKHPMGTNFAKTDIPGVPLATVPLVVDTMSASVVRVRWWRYPGYGVRGDVRGVVPPRGMGPGCPFCTVSPL